MACAQWHSGFPSLLLLELCLIIYLKYRVSTFSDRTKALYFIKKWKGWHKVLAFHVFRGSVVMYWIFGQHNDDYQLHKQAQSWLSEGSRVHYLSLFTMCFAHVGTFWHSPYLDWPLAGMSSKYIKHSCRYSSCEWRNAASTRLDASREIQLDAYIRCER